MILSVLLAALLQVSAEPRTDYLRAEETIPIAMIAGAVDWWTVEDLMERKRARELNPLGQSIGKRGALQLVHVGAHIYLTHEIDRKYGRKWGKRTLWGIAILKFGVAAFQFKQARY